MITGYRYALSMVAVGLAAFWLGTQFNPPTLPAPETPAVHAFTDPGTGCHYLVTSTGAITPRLHSDGIQVCELSEEGWPLDQNHEDYDEIMPPAEEPEPTAIRVANPTQARIVL